jgi:hypothetical protein
MLSIDYTKSFEVKLQFKRHCAYKSNQIPLYSMKLLRKCFDL